MKERLRSYSRLLDEIDIKERRARAVDGVDRYACRRAKRALGGRLERLKLKEACERERLTGIISKLDCEKQRQVIFARYFDGHSWMTVCELVFGAREDFEEKAESYQRRIFRIHGNALDNLNKFNKE